MKKSLLPLLGLCAITAASAQGMNMPLDGGRKAAASSPRAAMPLVAGVVQRVDAAKGLIVLKHGDIPNLAMPAMTMGFDVADPKMLHAVKAGDHVKFQAEMVRGKATVTELKKVP